MRDDRAIVNIAKNVVVTLSVFWLIGKLFSLMMRYPMTFIALTVLGLIASYLDDPHHDARFDPTNPKYSPIYASCLTGDTPSYCRCFTDAVEKHDPSERFYNGTEQTHIIMCQYHRNDP